VCPALHRLHVGGRSTRPRLITAAYIWEHSTPVQHIHALSCGFVEPKVGFEPTTFRLRVGCSASTWMASEGSSLLTLDALSVQTAPDGSRRIVWMIKRMIKGHPTKNRMAR
jgi:hypothetical protein